MSESSQGDGWWLASDGKWYPPTSKPHPPPPPAETREASEQTDEPRPRKRRKRWLVWVGVAVTAFVALGVVGLIIEEDESPPTPAHIEWAILSPDSSAYELQVGIDGGDGQPVVMSVMRDTDNAERVGGLQFLDLETDEAVTFLPGDSGRIEAIHHTTLGSGRVQWKPDAVEITWTTPQGETDTLVASYDEIGAALDELDNPPEETEDGESAAPIPPALRLAGGIDTDFDDPDIAEKFGLVPAPSIAYTVNEAPVVVNAPDGVSRDGISVTGNCSASEPRVSCRVLGVWETKFRITAEVATDPRSDYVFASEADCDLANTKTHRENFGIEGVTILVAAGIGTWLGGILGSPGGPLGSSLGAKGGGFVGGVVGSGLMAVVNRYWAGEEFPCELWYVTAEGVEQKARDLVSTTELTVDYAANVPQDIRAAQNVAVTPTGLTFLPFQGEKPGPVTIELTPAAEADDPPTEDPPTGEPDATSGELYIGTFDQRQCGDPDATEENLVAFEIAGPSDTGANETALVFEFFITCESRTYDEFNNLCTGVHAVTATNALTLAADGTIQGTASGQQGTASAEGACSDFIAFPVLPLVVNVNASIANETVQGTITETSDGYNYRLGSFTARVAEE